MNTIMLLFIHAAVKDWRSLKERYGSIGLGIKADDG